MIFFLHNFFKVCDTQEGTEAKLEPQFVILAPAGGNLKFRLLGSRLQLHNNAKILFNNRSYPSMKSNERRLA
jgi:hypothetical protein